MKVTQNGYDQIEAAYGELEDVKDADLDSETFQRVADIKSELEDLLLDIEDSWQEEAAE